MGYWLSDIGMVHGLMVHCLAYWYGACSTCGLFGLLAWYMMYWWVAWPTGKVHGLLLGCLAYWHGAWSTGGLLGLLACCVVYRRVCCQDGAC